MQRIIETKRQARIIILIKLASVPDSLLTIHKLATIKHTELQIKTIEIKLT